MVEVKTETETETRDRDRWGPTGQTKEEMEGKGKKSERDRQRERERKIDGIGTKPGTIMIERETHTQRWNGSKPVNENNRERRGRDREVDI